MAMAKQASGYITLDVEISALQRMLRDQALHVSEVHCHDCDQKRVLQNLLLALVKQNAQSD